MVNSFGLDFGRIKGMEKVEIVFEDEVILIINKPAGLVVTSEGVLRGKTLEDWLQQHYPNNNLERRGIVHRLDKGTSGLMVVAKTKESLINLKKQFKDRLVGKEYLSLVSGDVSSSGQIDAPIKRSKRLFSRYRVDPEGKLAKTEFRVEKKYELDGKIYSLLRVILKTGRTHQIRVHFSYLQWPLVGDVTYGGRVIFGMDRPFLHSTKLGLIHPESGQWMEWENEMGADLIAVLKNLNELK